MDNTIDYIIAGRGQGKTTLMTGGFEEPGLLQIYFEKGMSSLIIDTLAHPKYNHIPYLDPKNYGILSSKIGVYKTVVPLQHTDEFFQDGYLNNVWNTQIILEDSHKYLDPGIKLTKSQKALLGDSRQQNNDIKAMTWCWAWTHPGIIRLCNHFTMGKTPDGPEWRKQYLGGCYPNLLKAHNLVMKGKSRFLTVDSGI